jgi:hypothetical protein
MMYKQKSVAPITPTRSSAEYTHEDLPQKYSKYHHKRTKHILH